MSLQRAGAVGLFACLFGAVAPACADPIGDCETFAMAFFAQQGANLKSIAIDRTSIIENRFDANVGSQRVSTEYIGWAEATWTDDTTRERFVCLHEGDGHKPVYFTFVPLE